MAVTLNKQQGIYEPAISCDQCHERIEDAGLAMVILRDDGPVYLHKGRCDDEAGNKGQPWAELGDFLERLGESVGAR